MLGLRFRTKNVSEPVMPMSSDPVLLRGNFLPFICSSLKRLKLTMTYSVSFDGQDIDDFRQMSVFSCRNTFVKKSVAYKNSNLYQLVALYKNGEQERASSKTPMFQFWPEHGIHQPTKVLDDVECKIFQGVDCRPH